MPYGLCVDLGTTWTAAAMTDGKLVEVVPLATHSTLIPSLVHRDVEGNNVFGETARVRGGVDPAGLARAFKRQFGDPTPIILNGTAATAGELIAELLDWVVGQVSERQGEAPAAGVLTHPATWTSTQLAPFEAIGSDAFGISPILLPEPVAIAVHYSTQRQIGEGATVAVYDFGGGTFDATVLERDRSTFRIVGDPIGLHELGGIDLDDLVLQFVLESAAVPRSDLDRNDLAVARGLERLRRSCIEAKEALSESTTATVALELPGHTRDIVVNRDDFEERARPLIASTVETLLRAVTDAGRDPGQVEAVLLGGGSSRVPLVAELLSESFHNLAFDLHPKLSVVRGGAAAIEQRALTSPVRRRDRVESGDGGAPPSRPSRLRQRWLVGVVVLLAAIVVPVVLAQGDGDEGDAGVVSTTIAGAQSVDASAASTTTPPPNPELVVSDTWNGGLGRDFLEVLCGLDYRAVGGDTATCSVSPFDERVVVQLSACASASGDPIDQLAEDARSRLPGAEPPESSLRVALVEFTDAARDYLGACPDGDRPAWVSTPDAQQLWFTLRFDADVRASACRALSEADAVVRGLDDTAAAVGCVDLVDQTCARFQQLAGATTATSDELDGVNPAPGDCEAPVRAGA